MKKVIALLLALAMVFSLAACANNSKPEDPKGDDATPKRKIGVYLYNSMMPSAYPIIEGMIDYINEQGDEYIFVAADGTAENELQVFDELVARDDLDAIVWPNINDTLFLDSIKRAREKGIVCSTMDFQLADDETTLLVCSQTLVDNYQGAYNAADAALTELENRGLEPKVIMGNYYAMKSIADRAYGYIDACKDHNAEILFEMDPFTGTSDWASTTEDLLITYPECNAIFCANDSSCVQALAGCKAQGRNDILLVSFDGGMDVQDFVLKGDIFASACQPLYEMGRNTVEMAYNELNGVEHEYWYHFQCKTITKDTVQEVIDQFANFEYKWMK